MDQIKTKERVIEYGEVFTPKSIVNAMLDLVKDEAQRIDSRFLEPACGSGNFLVEVLRRKLDAVETKYGTSEFEKKQYSMLSVMCIYGVELLPDNRDECREYLLQVLGEYFDLEESDGFALAAKHVLSQNIIQGDGLTYTNEEGEELVFPEWGYLGKGKFQRRDFHVGNMTRRAAIELIDPEIPTLDSWFTDNIPGYEAADYLAPEPKVYPPATISQLAEFYLLSEEE
jgi:hypothetical protein